MENEQKSGLAETLETGRAAAHMVRGAMKAGKAVSGAAKGAAAGPYGAVAGALWENRRLVGKVIIAVIALLLIPVVFVVSLPAVIFGGLSDAFSSTALTDAPILNNNAAIMENVSEITAAIDGIMSGGLEDTMKQIEADFASSGADEMEVINPYAGSPLYNANHVAALLCSPVITLVACHRINRYNDMRTEKGKGSRTPIFRREPCSGTTIKTWLLYQDMKWNTRRTKIFLINSKEECICPCCGSPLKYRDSRKRVHKVAGGGKEWYLIRRLRCSSDKCGKLHNELPDCICPYKHYDAGLIEDVADGVVSEVDTETEDYPCEGTMKHWRWWLWMNEKNMEGHLRLAAHRFLDLDGKFLKSRASLLEEMKERISPGWLKAAARVIYNSGGRIEPYPSAA